MSESKKSASVYATDLPVAPIRPQVSLRETVTETLRTEIISGNLEEGTLYSAPALASALGVSATPVREAMMDLGREGLVETVKNKGFRVLGMTDSELDELTEIRLLVEAPIVGRLVGKIPDNDFPHLRILAQAIVSATERGSLSDYLVADRAFHAELLRYYGNGQLVELATQLRMRTRMYGLRLLNESNKLADSANEHHQLLDLLQAGDAEGAEALIRSHLGHARDLWATGAHEIPRSPKP